MSTRYFIATDMWRFMWKRQEHGTVRADDILTGERWFRFTNEIGWLKSWLGASWRLI